MGTNGGKASPVRALAAPSRIVRLLEDRAVRAGLLPGSRSYVRFVVLGWYRTGSNLLVTLLGSHPEIVAYSELFSRRRIFWGNRLYRPPGDDVRRRDLRRRDPGGFLDSLVYRPYARRIRAVGFKLFYTQAGRGWFPGLTERLVGDRELRIVHLVRRSPLRILVSSEIARRTGEMSSTSCRRSEEALGPILPLRLEVPRVVKYCEDLRAWEERMRPLLAGRAVRRITYEGLCSDPRGEMEGVQRFLGVRPRRLRSPLVKQNRRPLEEVVENLAEIRRALRGTRFEEACDEEGPVG